MQKSPLFISIDKRFIFLLIISFLLIILIPRTQAHTGDIVYSSWTAIPPTIDGIFTQDEWKDPVITKTLEYYNSDTKADESHLMEVSFVNDDQDLYLGIIIRDEDFETSETGGVDVIEVYFDDDNDGTIKSKDDIHNFWNLEYGDWHFETGGRWSEDSQKNGIGVDTHSNQAIGDYIYEFQIPLDSGDEQDISVQPGDTLGIKILYREMVHEEAIYWSAGEDGWPNDQDNANGTTYGDLVIVTEQMTIPTTSKSTSNTTTTTTRTSTPTVSPGFTSATTTETSTPTVSPGFTTVGSVLGVGVFVLFEKRRRKKDNKTK
ncbi:MAG: hypothetical protein ACFFB5_22400 [Promethearchaeota archaeon]